MPSAIPTASSGYAPRRRSPRARPDLTLHAMGRGLSAGDVVLTGSICKVLRPKAGDSIRASFTRLGSVGCRVV